MTIDSTLAEVEASLDSEGLIPDWFTWGANMTSFLIEEEGSGIINPDQKNRLEELISKIKERSFMSDSIL